MNIKTNNEFLNNLNVREKIEKNNKKIILAQKLLEGKLTPEKLTETEVDEMTKYFEQDIKK